MSMNIKVQTTLNFWKYVEEYILQNDFIRKWELPKAVNMIISIVSIMSTSELVYRFT
jgi:hypothetical protein